MPVHQALLACLLVLVAGCGPLEEPSPPMPEGPSGIGRQEIIYGTDNRLDVYAHPDSTLRTLAQQSTVALMAPSSLDTSNPNDVAFIAPTLQAQYNLCSDQRFLTDPTPAFCTGTLIDDDLVLTAGHCITSALDCANTRFVFNFYRPAAGALQTVTTADIFSCQSIVVQEWATVNGRDLDYAIVRLDRAATPRFTPAPVRDFEVPLAPGTSLSVIGAGSGIPLKIDSGGAVRDGRSGTLDYFVANTDSFKGHSGAGVYDTSSHAVVGILVRGPSGEYALNGSCRIAYTCSETGCLGVESTYVMRAIDAYCAVASSARLCSPFVGVLSAGSSCPVGTPTVKFFMDNEDDSPSSSVSGWAGATNVDSNGNTHLTFCRVDGRDFHSLQAASSGRSNYAVLKLSRTCPAGSVEFTRFFDNEDDDNQNSSSGPLAPNVQDRNTTLRFCLFKGDGPVAAALPTLGFDYGVFATSAFGFRAAFGSIHTDDEDSNNANSYSADAAWKSSATALVTEGSNTTLYTAKAAFPICTDTVCNGVETDVSCPQDCDRCGNGSCSPTESSNESCAYDCGGCDDEVCGYNESSFNCPQDCSSCGDGFCDPGELACAEDCGSCVEAGVASTSLIYPPICEQPL